MAQALLKEQQLLLKAVTNPKLQVLLRELVKHIQEDQRKQTQDSGCG